MQARLNYLKMKENKNTPDISVLISAFNEEQHIQFSIDSVLIEKSLDIELILVDDCSTDNTLKIMKYCAERDSRIRVIQIVNDQLNEDVQNDIIFRLMKFETASYSIASSQNIGLNFCRGKYIARLDADDLMINDRLNKQFVFMEENVHIDLVACGGERINENGDIFGKYTIFSIFHEDISKDLIMMRSRMPHPGWMVKASVYKSLEGYSLSYANFRLDLDFMLKLLENDFQMACLKEPLIHYRQWSGNISKLKDMKLATMYTLTRHHLRLQGVVINDRINDFIEEKINRKVELVNLEKTWNSYHSLKSSYICLKTGKVFKSFLFLFQSISNDLRIIFSKDIASRIQAKIINETIQEYEKIYNLNGK